MARRGHGTPPTHNDWVICPFAKDPNSPDSGTGGPKPKTPFKGCDGKTYKRNAEGNIPDEYGKDHQRMTNAPRTLSMANTGDPNSGGSQFFINVNHPYMHTSSRAFHCHCTTNTRRGTSNHCCIAFLQYR